MRTVWREPHHHLARTGQLQIFTNGSLESEGIVVESTNFSPQRLGLGDQRADPGIRAGELRAVTYPGRQPRLTITHRQAKTTGDHSWNEPITSHPPPNGRARSCVAYRKLGSLPLSRSAERKAGSKTSPLETSLTASNDEFWRHSRGGPSPAARRSARRSPRLS
jgi:hypothetical protein